MRFNDLTGIRFDGPNGESLTALRFVGRSRTRVAMWECRCGCGNLHTTYGTALRSGRMYRCPACGRKAIAKHARLRQLTHGKSKTGEYAAWNTAKRHGVLCREWSTFEAFFAALGEFNGRRLHRPDISRPMGPGNCELRFPLDISEFADRPVSRQRKRQLAWHRDGRCVTCGDDAGGMRHCPKCRKKVNEYRKRVKAKHG